MLTQSNLKSRRQRLVGRQYRLIRYLLMRALSFSNQSVHNNGKTRIEEKMKSWLKFSDHLNTIRLMKRDYH